MPCGMGESIAGKLSSSVGLHYLPLRSYPFTGILPSLIIVYYANYVSLDFRFKFGNVPL